MRGDVEAAGGGRQMELPLSLQVALGVHPERARGYAPTVVCNAKDLHRSCHDFPASYGRETTYRTTRLYDRREDRVTLDEVVKINIRG
jgi:hypothetical protein